MTFRERKIGGPMNAAFAADAHYDAMIRWNGRFRRVFGFP